MRVATRKQDWRVPFFAGFITACLLVIWAGCTDSAEWTDDEIECAAFIESAIAREGSRKTDFEEALMACREYIEEYGPWGRWNDEE